MSNTSYFASLIANAPVQTSSRYFEAGTYLVEVDHCKFFLNRKRQMRAAVEVTVLESNNVTCPETTQLTWIVALDSDSGPSTLKTFMVNLMGCRATEITDEVVNKIFIDQESDSTDASIATGLQCIVNAHEKPTQSGGTFTRVLWKRFDSEKDTRPDFRAMTQVGAQPTIENEEVTAEVSDNIPF